MHGIMRILDRVREEWESAPDSEYKQGGIDALDLLENDLFDAGIEEDDG